MKPIKNEFNRTEIKTVVYFIDGKPYKVQEPIILNENGINLLSGKLLTDEDVNLIVKANIPIVEFYPNDKTPDFLADHHSIKRVNGKWQKQSIN